MGVGTPMIESLSSYIVRLASAHCVTVGTLVGTEIAPLINKPYLTGRRSATISTQFSYISRAVNSFGVTAIDWVNALQKLTLRQDLRFLTLLPLKGVLTDNKLLHKVRVWCPNCYEEWRQNDKPVYDPLMWSIRVVTVCQTHKRHLIDKCVHCEKQSPALSCNSQAGFCRHCNLWLGVTSLPILAEDRLLTCSEFKWQSWVIDHLGTTFIEMFRAASPLEAKVIRQLIFICLQRTTRGDVQAFVRRFSSFSYAAMFTWLQGYVLPELERLMMLCYQTEVSMKDVLFGRESIDNISQGSFPVPLKNSYHVSTTDVARMAAALRSMLDEDPPPSQKETATRLGCHVTTIKKHLPHLFSLVQSRYSAFEADRFDKIKIKSSLVKATEEHPPPSLSSVVKKLGCSRAFLRKEFADDCRIITKRYDEFRKVFVNLEEVRANLLALQSEVPPLSIGRCAERIGCSRDYLSRNFPEICRAIGARYYDYFQEITKRKREYRQKAIIDTYAVLEAEGINPTIYQINKRLPHIHGLTNREIEGVIRQIGC
jgi:hypothetical protein